MARVQLQPLAKHPEALLTYIDINFRRITDLLASLSNVEQGIIEVTGSIQIDTGLPEVYNVFAGFNGTPTANTAYVQAFLLGTSEPRTIEIKVFTSSFAAATTPVNIAWYAIGE